MFLRILTEERSETQRRKHARKQTNASRRGVPNPLERSEAGQADTRQGPRGTGTCEAGDRRESGGRGRKLRPSPLIGVAKNPGMILYLAADLLWASKIKGTADALSIPCRPVRTLEMLEARLGESTAENPARALLLDLDKAEEALAMITRVRSEERWRGVRVVCFGPHVLKELFQQARDAGADEVMPRGSLDARLDEVLLKLEGGSRS